MCLCLQGEHDWANTSSSSTRLAVNQLASLSSGELRLHKNTFVLARLELSGRVSGVSAFGAKIRALSMLKDITGRRLVLCAMEQLDEDGYVLDQPGGCRVALPASCWEVYVLLPASILPELLYLALGPNARKS